MPPEEPERRVTFPSVPVPGEHYVFVVVPGSESLARVHLDDTLAVDEVPLGEVASTVAALPGRDVAVALAGDGLALVVDSTGDGEPAVHALHVVSDLTHLAASPSEPYVVAWADHDEAPTGNDNEVSVVDLSPLDSGGKPRAHDLSVGERPRDVFFDTTGRRALIVTDAGVSVVRDLTALDGDDKAPAVPVHEDSRAPAAGRRVVPTPDGRWALVVQPEETVLRLVDLDAGTERPDPPRLELDATPTDVVLLPSEGAVRALVVLREAAQAALVTVPGDFEGGAFPRWPLAEQQVGQAVVSADGTYACLFTTSRASDVLVLLDLRDGVAVSERARPVRLDATITALALSPSGRAAVAFHPAPATEGAPAFSLLSFEGRLFAKPFATRGAPAGAFLFVPPDLGVEQLLVALDHRARGVREVWSVPVDSFIAETLRLRAPPVAVGLVPSSAQAFVTQDDPEGLITFLGLDGDLSPRDVSRFRRNRRID